MVLIFCKSLYNTRTRLPMHKRGKLSYDACFVKVLSSCFGILLQNVSVPRKNSKDCYVMPWTRIRTQSDWRKFSSSSHGMVISLSVCSVPNSQQYVEWEGERASGKNDHFLLTSSPFSHLAFSFRVCLCLRKLSIALSLTSLHPFRHPIGHFRIPLCLCFKASLSSKPLLWK